MGLLPGGASTEFADCRDVSFGGALCALPALNENGLFRHLDDCFPSLDGYYTTLQVVTKNEITPATRLFCVYFAPQCDTIIPPAESPIRQSLSASVLNRSACARTNAMADNNHWVLSETDTSEQVCS